MGTAFLRPNLEGSSNSGAENAIVPPSNSRLDDMGSCKSSAIVVNPKSARHALGGVSFVTRMFAYWGIRTDGYIGWWPGTNPFEIPVDKICVMEIIHSLRCTM